MPSQKPRVALTLSEDTRKAFYDYAEAVDQPAAKVIADLLAEMVPQIRELTKFQRAVKAGKVSVARDISRRLLVDSIHGAIDPQVQLEVFAQATEKKAKK